ncbi:MAG: hypothetical protein LBD55_03775 [Treponema sp.]|nr:hypothetical protein [Treponema sp.]
MKKMPVAYWSGRGNIETAVKRLAGNAGEERRVKLIFETVADMFKEADALVFS